MHPSSPGPRLWAIAVALLLGALLSHAQSMPVRVPQGTMHGFLALQDTAGKSIGFGDLVQSLHREQVTIRLTLHFYDGSLDQETSTFAQGRDFRFVSDHLVQHGPLFAEPVDLTLQASGDLTLRSRTAGNRQKIETSHLTLPANIANGMVPVLLLNLPPHAAEADLSMVVPHGKGRIVNLKITPDGTETFTAAGERRAAEVFLIHPQIGGIAGVVAPLVGKQPLDAHLWYTGGEAPQILRFDSQLSEEGPIVSVRLAGINFPADSTRP